MSRLRERVGRHLGEVWLAGWGLAGLAALLTGAALGLFGS